MRLRDSIEVPRPQAETFAYVADWSHLADWDPGIAESRKVSDGPVGTGTQFDVLADFRGRTIPMRYTIIEFEEGRRVVLDGQGDNVTSVDEITVEEIESGSRITYDADIKMKGIYRIVQPFLGGTFNKMGQKALAGLKKELDQAS